MRYQICIQPVLIVESNMIERSNEEGLKICILHTDIYTYCIILSLSNDEGNQMAVEIFYNLIEMSQCAQ